MKQGMKLVSLFAALALFAVAAPTPAPAGVTMIAAASKSGASGSKAKSRSKSLRQFTGTITALDASSITVEKGGRKPKTMVFSKHEEMRSQGEVEKNAHVTVYYRDEDGHPVAHRVVVKPEKGGAKNGR